MGHRFAETRYYVVANNNEEEIFGCPLAHFPSREEAIKYCESLEIGKKIVVEEVTWHNDSHRSHSIIYTLN